MKKIPKYAEQETILNANVAAYEKSLDNYSLTKRINKFNNQQLFEFIKEEVGNIYKITPNLYQSNHAYSFWNMYKSQVAGLTQQLTFDILLTKILTVSNNFVNNRDNLMILLSTIDYIDYSIKPIDEWVPKSKNAKAQGISLIKHLFSKYEVPEFLEDGFITNNTKYIDLYLYIGSGGSLKKYQNYPYNLQLPKKGMNHLLTTPHDLNLFWALRRVQVLNMGGDDYIFNALMRAPSLRVATTIDKEEFNFTLLQYFVTNQMFESSKIAEVVDYIIHIKYGNNVDSNPNFTMKNRSAQLLLDLSDTWHSYNSKIAKTKPSELKWAPVAYENLLIEKNENNLPVEYTIQQLTTGVELKDEGLRMHHCVGSYTQRCSVGLSSIFSVRKYQYNNLIETFATVEIRGNSIDQIRGKYNGKPSNFTLTLIGEWAHNNRLLTSKYAL